jgi:hypothetical protein
MTCSPLFKIMLIYLNPRPQVNFATAVHTSPDEILSEKVYKKIHKHDGPKILVSDDQSIAARVWMILSQIGIKDLYILNEP